MQKILSVEAAGQDEEGIFNRVAVTLELDGEAHEGFILFETDGRDIELEGGLEGVEIDWEAIWSDAEATQKLEDAIAACGGE